MMADGQMSLVEALVHPAVGSNRKIDALADMINWKPIGKLARKRPKPGPGRPPYDPLMMLKALYLAALYDLSDPGLEEALGDRISFRRFCGLDLADATPDETTICRFRAWAAESGLMEAAFEEINRQLDAAGLIVRKGTMMDATIIAAAHNPPPKDAGMGVEHPHEPGATWTKKGNKAYFGYKLHIGMDEGSGLVRRVAFTGARTADSAVADDLISWDEKSVYADKAYPLKARRARLRAAGIKDRIAHRRHKTQKALPRWREHWNRLVARRRAPVEAVFSAGKRLYGLSRARCHSLSRNAVRVLAFATVYNLRRAMILTA